MPYSRYLLVGLPLLALATARPAAAQAPAPTRTQDSLFVRQHYRKVEQLVPMRDGTRLATILYVPRDASPTRRFPFLMERTPYSAGPRGAENYPTRGPGPSRELSQEKYIFVYQDVRGRYLSEGQFEEMTPALASPPKSGLQGKAAPHDESTDTYDTIEWLLKNVAGNNGRVGLMGISYPAFTPPLAYLMPIRPSRRCRRRHRSRMSLSATMLGTTGHFSCSTTSTSPIISTCPGRSPWPNTRSFSH